MPLSTAFPKRKLEQYRRIAQRAGRVWRELGALEYRERAGGDLKTRMGTRAHRDRVNAR